MKTKPMTILLAMLAGWINREQQQIIEYLKAENGILKEELLKATGKEAIKTCNRAIVMDPTDALAWHRKGTIHASLGYYNKALEVIIRRFRVP